MRGSQSTCLSLPFVTAYRDTAGPDHRRPARLRQGARLAVERALSQVYLDYEFGKYVRCARDLLVITLPL